MRKSKADTAETRKRIVAMASKVFLADGLSATGIADIMAASGLTQGGFYRHFESKEQLVAEANEAAFDELFAMFDTVTAGKSPQEALEIIVTRYLNQLQPKEVVYLCPLANLASELRYADKQIKAVANEGYARLVKLLASHLMRMDFTDYMGIAEAIVSTMVGAVSLARLTVDPAISDSILANAKNTVNLILQNSSTSKSLRQAVH